MATAPRGATGAGHNRSGERSGEQHGESRAVAVVAAIDPQLAADLRGKGGNQGHSHAFAGGGIESLRQAGAVVAHRQGMALSGLRERYLDPPPAVLDGVGDQLVDDDAKGQCLFRV